MLIEAGAMHLAQDTIGHLGAHGGSGSSVVIDPVAAARSPRARVGEDVGMTPEQWIELYRRAWETADADQIVDLFTPDASYRSGVFRKPHIGSDAIRQYWQDAAGTQREVAVRMGVTDIAIWRSCGSVP